MYTYRRENFIHLVNAAKGLDGLSYEPFTAGALLANYLLPDATGSRPAVYNIRHSNMRTNDLNLSPSRYASGYVATLYLAELAARQAGSSSVTHGQNGWPTNISTERLRWGLNSILERMNKGETLDQVIHDISPVSIKDNTTKLYASTDDFAKKFIGTVVKEDSNHNVQEWMADDQKGASLEFTIDLIWYMEMIKHTKGFIPNGSILFDFDRDFDFPLDPSKTASSEYYKIIESNTYTDSTVPDDVALPGGGKSAAGERGNVPAPTQIPEGPVGESASDGKGDASSDEPDAASNTPSDPAPDATNQDEQVLPMAAKATETTQPTETTQVAEDAQPTPVSEVAQPAAPKEPAVE
ncbi:MAG: hypothetical protein IKF78_07520 [Atopobiaceae bacterium]|nr:hypothetical protein [Atopobiaceae bacterium]